MVDIGVAPVVEYSPEHSSMECISHGGYTGNMQGCTGVYGDL